MHAECNSSFPYVPSKDHSDVSLFITELSDSELSVTINAKFERTMVYEQPLLLARSSVREPCESTGVFEKGIFNEIERSLRE